MLGQKLMFLFIDGGNTPFVLYSTNLTLFIPLPCDTTIVLIVLAIIGILTNKSSLNW